jgi:hypothetical protein
MKLIYFLLIVGSIASDSNQALLEISKILKEYERNRIGENYATRSAHIPTRPPNRSVNRPPIRSVNRPPNRPVNRRNKQIRKGNLRGTGSDFTSFVNHSGKCHTC